MAALFDAKHGSKVMWKGVLIIWMIYLPIIRSTHIEVDDEDGGYKKIVIAVSKRTLETISDLSELESNLKNFFSNVSEKLYQATRNRVFFKEIQVLLPNSVITKIDIPKEKIGNSTFESYQEADIRFDTFNPVPDRGDLYTNQPRGCGKRGDFIYLNPNYTKYWISEPNDVKVHRFVQEWSKFRYGVFEENGDGNGIFPSNYIYKNGTIERTGCSASGNSFVSIMDDEKLQGKVFCGEDGHEHNNIAPNRHNAFCKNNSTWNVISRNDDFAKLKSKTDNSGTTTIKPAPELKINFVKLLANVIIVIDPLLCKADEWKTVLIKGSHMLNLALRKFIQDSPDYVQIGIIVAVTHPKKTKMARDSTSLVNEFHGIINQYKRSLDARDLNYGIKEGYKSLKQLSGNGYLVVITSEKRLQDLITSPHPSLQRDSENLFLLTWSEKTTKLQWSDDNLEQMKNFVNDPTRNLWINIKPQNSISNCDVNSRLQIEDASHQFYAGFLLDDFYSAKTKIGNYEMTPNEEHSFKLPLPSASVLFNIYGCKYDNDDRWATLTVNGNPETINTENFDRDISVSYKWEKSTPTNSAVKFKAHILKSDSVGTSVWIDVAVGTTTFTAIDTKFEKKDDDDSLLIFYAFNPSDLKLEAYIIPQSEKHIKLKFDDNGNGDPDVIAGDKIYSRYFISPEITDGVYSIKTIAKDADDNIIDQRNLGYIPLKSQNIDQFPPSRIVDLRLTSVNIISQSATLSWTSPGEHYDTGLAKAYYINCKTNFDEINLETVNENTKIELTPKPSGSNEQYIWSIPQRKTVYLCTIASTSNNNKNSEWSNVIAIYVEELPTNTTTIGYGIGAAVAGGIVILILFILGTVYLPCHDVTKFPPNRIGDLRVNVTADNSHIATFTWTAPGGHYDYGSAIAYYLHCNEELHVIIFQEDALKDEHNKLEQTPKESGSQETSSWTISSIITTYYCVMLSQNKYNIWSEISNVVVIYPTSTIPKVSTTEHILYGIGAAIAGTVVILLLFILIRRITKQKRKKDTSPVNTDNKNQVVNPSSTKQNKIIYENSSVIPKKQYKDNLEVKSLPKIAKPSKQLPLCEDEYAMSEFPTHSNIRNNPATLSPSGSSQSQTTPLLSSTSGHHYYNAKPNSSTMNQTKLNDTKFLKSSPVQECDEDEDDDFSQDEGIIQPYAIYVPRKPINRTMR